MISETVEITLTTTKS